MTTCGRSAEEHSSDVRIGGVNGGNLLSKRRAPLTGCVHEVSLN